VLRSALADCEYPNVKPDPDVHTAFAEMTPQVLKGLCGDGNGSGVVMDVKGVLVRDEVEKVGLGYWGL
jgi:UDP-N-acetyl-D-galactosamine dehydrogenase